MMHHGSRLKLGRGLLGMGLGLALAACQTIESTVDRTVDAVTGRTSIPFGTPGFVAGFLGGVAADEPRAASRVLRYLSDFPLNEEAMQNVRVLPS